MSQSTLSACIRLENCTIQEQISLWNSVPLGVHQADQMQRMITSVGNALNRQSFIDSNVRCLKVRLAHNQAKIDKISASEFYRNKLRSRSSHPPTPVIMPKRKVSAAHSKWPDCLTNAELAGLLKTPVVYTLPTGVEESNRERFIKYIKKHPLGGAGSKLRSNIEITLLQMSQKSKENDRNGIDPAVPVPH